MKDMNESEIDELVHQAIINSCDNLDVSLKLVDQAFSGLNCPWVEHCVRTTVMKFFIDTRPTEQNVYTWFRRVYKEKLGQEWDIIKAKNNPKHIPDFWLSNGKEKVPVECKKGDFNANSLKQLKRYIEYYGCEKGIAVAQSLCVDLPSNITFIGFSIEELENM